MVIHFIDPSGKFAGKAGGGDAVGLKVPPVHGAFAAWHVGEIGAGLNGKIINDIRISRNRPNAIYTLVNACAAALASMISANEGPV